VETLPLAGEALLLAVSASLPGPDFLEELPFIAGQIPVQVVRRAPCQKKVEGVAENLLEMKVQCSGRAMEIHVRVQVQAGIDKAAQGGHAGLVKSKALVREKRVEPEPCHVHHIQGEAGH
jgi:hypothetical protein